MSRFIYKGEKTKEISFPLGGIGTGCIGLAGNGALIDWEIFNKPNKGSINGFTHFAIKAEKNGEVIDCRVLNGDLKPPYTGEISSSSFQGYGFGPSRATMAGVPHFKDVIFKGEFPFAQLNFIHDKFPGKVKMTAFNPYIPLNDKDSSIPGAFFEIEVENSTESEINYTLCLSLNNPFPNGTAQNSYFENKNLKGIKLTSAKYSEDDIEFGDLTVATDEENVSYQEYWFRGRWFDNLEIFWREFSSPGKLKNRRYDDNNKKKEQGLNSSGDVASLAVHVTIGPKEKKKIRYLITWNFPNCYNYWNPEGKCDCEGSQCRKKPNIWKNYYATLFKDSTSSAAYSMDNWDRLYEETLLFKETLFSSSLPEVALEAVAANISILKTPTCLRLEDGSFYGFEGCHCNSGCCEGSCTHVWNYAYAMPFLFPKLERSMRDLDFKYNMREDGGMSFRLQLPIGRERLKFRPCADGHFGGVIKTYREWKISGDTEWLKKHWPSIKKNIEFAWTPTNEDKWDPEKKGVLTGRQHHTLDMELFGPNSWLTGFYLAALKAASEMAEYLGEYDTAKEYRSIFEKGKKWVDENLFNGEYYHQIIDIKDKSILEPFGDAVEIYWNDEAQEIKYQIAEGSEIDQLNAQWHANLCGLGDIFDKKKRKKAALSMFKYNYKKTMREFFNPCRLYCLNDESGLVICDWPQGKYKPVVPLPYSEETQNGYEYQAAVLMIQEGLVEEGLEIVRAIRDRYDGEKRNPWNEFECGNNYARSMASYSLLLAFSGFKYNMVKKMIGFDPIQYDNDSFRTFWSLDCGWGIFEIRRNIIELKVLYGNLEIATFNLPFLKDKEIVRIKLEDEEVEYKYDDGNINFAKSLKIGKGSVLMVEIC